MRDSNKFSPYRHEHEHEQEHERTISQYDNRAKAFAPHQNFGPAMSEAAEPRCATPSAIKLPDTPCWSEARPR
jgi:hypothetical protein